MAREPERLQRDEREGAASGPDPAAGGGPHRTDPAGARPIWRAESERAGRSGFLRAAVVVLGVIAALWLLMHAFSLWMSAERDVATPGARGGGAGYAEPEPGTLTPGGPASANPEPGNPMRVDPDSVDGPQRPGEEAGTAPR